ncbi:MAG: DUF748 domain-containing protein [Candidatus Omnitrophota bacterium]
MKKIILALGIIVVMAFLVLYLLAPLLAKEEVEKRLQQLVGRSTTIRSLSLSPPLRLSLDGLRIEGLATVENITISPSLLGMFSGRLALNNVTIRRPQISLRRQRQGGFGLVGLANKAAGGKMKDREKPVAPVDGAGDKGSGPGIIVADIRIIDGRVSVSDEKRGISFDIEKIEAHIFKAGILPSPLVVNYRISASVPCGAADAAALRGKGWVDWTHKDMQGNLDVTGIDAAFFRPYFRRLIPGGEGAPRFTADLDIVMSAKSNDLVARCGVSLKSASVSDKAGADSLPDQVMRALDVNLLKDSKGEINLELTLNTRLDRPRWENVKFKGKIFRNVINNAIKRPQAIVDSAREIGKQIKAQGENRIKGLIGAILGDIIEKNK